MCLLVALLVGQPTRCPVDVCFFHYAHLPAPTSWRICVGDIAWWPSTTTTQGGSCRRAGWTRKTHSLGIADIAMRAVHVHSSCLLMGSLSHQWESQQAMCEQGLEYVSGSKVTQPINKTNKIAWKRKNKSFFFIPPSWLQANTCLSVYPPPTFDMLLFFCSSSFLSWLAGWLAHRLAG